MLEQELKRADMLQRDRLDPLMQQFEETNPRAFADFRNARILGGRPRRRWQPGEAALHPAAPPPPPTP